MIGAGNAETDGGPESMAYKPFDGDALIDAAAPLLQLRIDPEFRAGIRFNLKAASKMAALVELYLFDQGGHLAGRLEVEPDAGADLQAVIDAA